jgi:hypothetical protein
MEIPRNAAQSGLNLRDDVRGDLALMLVEDGV